jgi:hypothetical protein
MEREQRAIDAMRARRQAELDQMVICACIRLSHIMFFLTMAADCLRGQAAAGGRRTAG